jgi:hypothetical protein
MTLRFRKIQATPVLVLVASFLALSLSHAVEITFDKDFIEANKNGATMTVPNLEVIDTRGRAKAIDTTGKNGDGDIQCSAWSDTVGFAIVAEIGNAAREGQYRRPRQRQAGPAHLGNRRLAGLVRRSASPDGHRRYRPQPHVHVHQGPEDWARTIPYELVIVAVVD